ncbi:uncharacterized protein LOC143550647 [Bidens hawaiensis]|uniref:uncharacterized protein LOC143550647 n=1 Tax=Bidens hawaiensis TaxID=980011 RepID=UPI00404929DF
MTVAKIMNAGYYWPDMHLDAVQEIRKCDPCQRHAPNTLRPKNKMIPVTSAWPFQKWAIDIMGSFSEAPERVKFLIVAIDYFTKLVEAKPVASITASSVKKFLWKFIICRFGLPQELAMIPVEIGIPSARVLLIDDSDHELRMILDLLEERRELALIREHNYKRQLQKYYNTRVQKCEFDAGDFVFRNNEASDQEHPCKLSPTWEGPYKIKQVLSKGAYKLEKIDGTEVPRTWNVAQLKKCYM